MYFRYYFLYVCNTCTEGELSRKDISVVSIRGMCSGGNRFSREMDRTRHNSTGYTPDAGWCIYGRLSIPRPATSKHDVYFMHTADT